MHNKWSCIAAAALTRDLAHSVHVCEQFKYLVILHFNNSIGSPVVSFDALSHAIESVVLNTDIIGFFHQQ